VRRVKEGKRQVSQDKGNVMSIRGPSGYRRENIWKPAQEPPEFLRQVVECAGCDRYVVESIEVKRTNAGCRCLRD
jgi:hypothetical protein